MTRKELYNICHDEAVAYANSEQWSKRTGEEKSFLIQGYLDAMMEARKSEITEKKKKYPKTYEECAEMLGECAIMTHGYKRDLLNALQKLIVCRDAYWKLYGEEMGLGKPWSPNDADYVTGRHCIFVHQGNIICSTPAEDCPLTFPTEEMRDAFYENFKELINSCKELL